jgi:hypothetical protein
MKTIQLDLFKPAPRRDEYLYPWEPIHKWQPQVGGLAQMHAVILPEHGYCFMDTVRINSIEGENVTCTVEEIHYFSEHKQGTVYHCEKSDLWPLLGVHF